MNHRAPQHPLLDWLFRQGNIIAYLGLAAVVALALWFNQNTQEADQRAVCEASEDARNVDRAQVESFYLFVLDSLPSPERLADMTFQQRQEVRNYKKRVEHYRNTLYTLIEPSEVCLPYVTDSDVKPPKTPGVNVPDQKDFHNG